MSSIGETSGRVATELHMYRSLAPTGTPISFCRLSLGVGGGRGKGTSAAEQPLSHTCTADGPPADEGRKAEQPLSYTVAPLPPTPATARGSKGFQHRQLGRAATKLHMYLLCLCGSP